MGTRVLVWEGKWPVLGRHGRAVEWLQVWADLGRAPRTVDGYARGLAEYLEMCGRALIRLWRAGLTWLRMCVSCRGGRAGGAQASW